MVIAIIQHQVKEFTAWKKIFDTDVPNLTKAGIKVVGIYRSVKNPNDVTLIFEAPKVELYDIIMSDAKRQEDIKKAGVIGAPVVTFLNKVQ